MTEHEIGPEKPRKGLTAAQRNFLAAGGTLNEFEAQEKDKQARDAEAKKQRGGGGLSSKERNLAAAAHAEAHAETEKRPVEDGAVRAKAKLLAEKMDLAIALDASRREWAERHAQSLLKNAGDAVLFQPVYEPPTREDKHGTPFFEAEEAAAKEATIKRLLALTDARLEKLSERRDPAKRGAAAIEKPRKSWAERFAGWKRLFGAAPEEEVRESDPVRKRLEAALRNAASVRRLAQGVQQYADAHFPADKPIYQSAMLVVPDKKLAQAAVNKIEAAKTKFRDADGKALKLREALKIIARKAQESHADLRSLFKTEAEMRAEMEARDAERRVESIKREKEERARLSAALRKDASGSKPVRWA